MVTRGNITRLLQRLQQRGLLTTEDNKKDGRSVICRLTPTGAQLLAQARVAASLFISEQLSPFDEETLVRTEELMNTMRRHLESMDPEEIFRQAQNTEKESKK